MDKLTSKQIDQFIELGYIKIENAFSDEIAKSCRSILWKEIGLDPNKPEEWNEPVIRIGELDHEPFLKAANTPILTNAYQQLAHENWLSRKSLGSFPLRFPSDKEAMDTGWHVDASFPGENPDNYLQWKINVKSKGRALLMLFLFTDVTDIDAPTRIKEGSHHDVARLLLPKGNEGMSFMDLAEQLDNLPKRKEVFATGKAGTVYLCHPFIVHAAQKHIGSSPKFMAQPPLLSKRDFNIQQPIDQACPIERAIIKAIR